MVDFRIEGAEQLATLSRKFKASSDKALRSELSKALNRATKRSKAAIRVSAQRLPHRGGLAARIAASKIVVRNRTTGRGDPMLQLVTSNKHNIRAIDKGIVRHPVYGNRKQWVAQRVPAGFWSNPMRLNEADTQRELAAAMDELQRKLSR